MSSSASYLLPAFVPPAAPTAPPGLVYQPDHRSDAESKLLHQFDDSAKLHAFVRALAGPMQYLEEQGFTVQGAFDVDTAIGYALDIVGGFVGVLRDGRSDIAYRAYVYARILSNASDGTRETIYGIVRALLGSVPAVQIVNGHHENHPAHFDLNVYATTLQFPWDAGAVEPPDVVAVSVADALALAVSGGVSFTFFYQYTPDANTFYFASGDVEEDSTTQGLADTDEDGSLGGALIGVEERH